MSGSIFGKLFRVSTWGESHGKALGVVIDGCPSGIELAEEDIQIQMDRRKPGSNKYGTKRNESDKIEIMSGVFEGKTTGTPISLMLFNNDNRSHDYDDIAQYYRPGHADYTFDAKYGFRDYRGGGRSSGRETSARVAAGAVAMKILEQLNIKINAYTISIGDIMIDRNRFDLSQSIKNALHMPDEIAFGQAEIYLKEMMKNKDSVGGVVECLIRGMIPGLGEPVFDKIEAELAKAVLSIGATKGIEFGLGFKAAQLNGSENNDEFYIDKNNNVSKKTNNSGGTLGGISDGSDIVFRVPFKPTPSISLVQNTVNKSNENMKIEISGRHDPVIMPRAVVVVESMAALVLVDLLLVNMTSKIDNLKKIYMN